MKLRLKRILLEADKLTLNNLLNSRAQYSKNILDKLPEQKEEERINGRLKIDRPGDEYRDVENNLRDDNNSPSGSSD